MTQLSLNIATELSTHPTLHPQFSSYGNSIVDVAEKNEEGV